MINEIEYKLKGNEFKLLQFFKGNQGYNSLSKIQEKTGITTRSLQKQISVLHGFYIIEVDNSTGINKYTVNDENEWRL